MPRKSTKTTTATAKKTVAKTTTAPKTVAPKKVAEKKVEPVKEAVKPVEVKKVEEKPVETKTVEVKKATVETKAEAKAVEAKKSAAKKVEEKPAEKKAEEVKPVETKAEKPAAKKTTTRKTTTAKKTTAVKKTTTAAKKATTTAKKTTAKKTTAKKTTTTKKAAPAKKVEMTKAEQYNSLSMDTIMDLLKAMGVQEDVNSIGALLMDNPEVKDVATLVIEKYALKDKFKFEEDGYDADLVEVFVQKVSDTGQFKPTKTEDLKTMVDAAIAYERQDHIADGEEYKAQFDVMRQVLMIAQHKNMHDVKTLNDEVGSDIEKFIVEFMDLAYDVLPTWKYEDVDYYEHFIYAVLSQLEDMHDAYRNRIMMDVADLYIVHGDYGLGDANYGYILRENQIKDYIYYRYAHVYEAIDRERAKQIANQALQFVDGRYTYYPNIMAILEG